MSLERAGERPESEVDGKGGKPSEQTVVNLQQQQLHTFYALDVEKLRSTVTFLISFGFHTI